MLFRLRLLRSRTFTRLPWRLLSFGTHHSSFTPLLLALLLAPSLTASAATFRFAWLSDTHVGSSTGEEDLRATVRDLNSLTGLSFVVISGDVTEFGSREQLRLAREILDGLKIPCHVVPGNHDTKWSESGATDFGRIWKEDRFVFEHGGFRFIGMHEGPIMKMGDGHWAPEDVRWLEHELRTMPDTNQPVIFVTHYPIDNGIDNWFVVLDLLKQYNTQAALCGHIHRNETNSFEGLPGVMGRSNLRGNAAAGGYTLVDVRDSRDMIFSERRPSGPTKSPWHSIVLEKHDFASQKKSPRPDFSVNERYPSVKERWRRDTGFTIAASPVVCNDLAVIGDASGAITAFSVATGEPQWQFKSRGAVYSTADTSGDLLICPSTDGGIYALKAATGKQAWNVKTDRPIVASPRISDGVVYVGSSEGKFRALDLASGNPIWTFDRLGGFVESRPLIHDGKVIFGAWDQYLYALETKTGRLLWKWKGDRAGTMFSPAACWPVSGSGKVFVVAPDRKMGALDAKTGAQVWRTGNYMVRESLGISEDQTRIYVRSMQDFFYAFSTAASQPEKLWETNAGFGYDINSAMLMEKDGMLFYGTKNGLLFALDPKSGAIKWQHKIGVSLVNTVLPLSASQLLATDFDGRIVLVEAH
jgi:outer membrane protein assembly factor BamB/predicted MPP superfamily phosphohydrolase